MELMRALSILLIQFFLIQVPRTSAQDCSIKSITSTSASSLTVKWNKYNGATNYFLDLRIVNASDVAPVVITLPASSNEKVVYGLWPATTYTVTIKVFQFYFMMCLDKKTATTVPATTQLSYSKAISSTAIKLEWMKVSGAEHYLVVVEPAFKTSSEKYNTSFTSLSAVVSNLKSATSYNCSVYTWNTAGYGASSQVRTITTLFGPPEYVKGEQTGYNTARITWKKVEKVYMYLVTVMDTSDPRTEPHVYNVTNTYLDLKNMNLCTDYEISISSYNAFLEAGDPTHFTYKINALSPVTGISVDYSCGGESTTVMWGIVYGADSYKVSAADTHGTVLSCASHSTACQISRIRCGERYLVNVTAIYNSCESMGNNSIYFETVPCPPTNVEVFRECSSNVIIFSWAASKNAFYYRAISVDSEGERKECLTKETSCFFTDTYCGRRYKFYVFATSHDCSSNVSSSIYVRTAPCLPVTVKTTSQCYTDVLTSTWDAAAGAKLYTLEMMGNKRNHYSCRSVTNSCAIPEVQCGESLTVWITTSDDECSSYKDLGEVARSIPCVPQNVSADLDCVTNTVRMHWEYSYGALFYIAAAVQSDGTVYTCITMEFSCVITGLSCGQTYTTYVVSSNYQCNSSESTHIIVHTALCPPQRVQADLDCVGNYALVSWQRQESASSYTATMEDKSGVLLSCSTTNDSCKIPDLKCGDVYEVRVTFHGGFCPAQHSKPFHIDSVPCGPSAMSAQVVCSTRTLDINWEASPQADSYVAKASLGQWDRIYCNTTELHCSISTLKCSQSYSVVVMSVTDGCLSFPSKEVTVQQVPCMPTNVTAGLDCNENTITVTWQPSEEASHYKATVRSQSGQRLECTSSGTTCDIVDIKCGQTYTIGVVAVGISCSSLESETVELKTVPCTPSHVAIRMDCEANKATILWDASTNALYYFVKGVGADGHMVSCSSSDPSCLITGLHCSQEYTFIVSANNSICQSPDSLPVQQKTGPCLPQNIRSHIDCSTEALTVSWDLDELPLSYNVTVSTSEGTTYSCASRHASCTIASLRCGQEYSAFLAVANGRCTSVNTLPQTIRSAPCVPQGVIGTLTCETNTLVTSWSSSSGASAYTTTVGGPSGDFRSCSTSTHTCTFDSLQCAQRYAISVVARDSQCNSTASPAISVATGPCSPEDVTVLLHCGDNVVTVSWSASRGAVSYTVVAESTTGHLSSCGTTDTSCQVTQLMCGQVYNITVLASDGTCNSSMANSVVETGPCPPVIFDHKLDCDTNIATVFWREEDTTVSYIISATSTLGHTTGCKTSGTSCDLIDLRCGNTYTVEGVSVGKECDSISGTKFTIIAVPCSPTMVKSIYHCSSNFAEFSWNETLGRERFFVHAEGGKHVYTCVTTGTTCKFNNLECHQTYTATVTAIATHCNSSEVAFPESQTAPCGPQDVGASLLCVDNTAEVTWEASAGAVSYNVTAETRGGDSKSCFTTQTSCTLARMQCGQTYVITVVPNPETCFGFFSSVITYVAGPCPPVSILVNLVCEDNVGMVSWDPVEEAEGYLATAKTVDADTHTCGDTALSCSLSDLHCDKTYSVSVVTLQRGCESEPSVTKDLTTAICPPNNLRGRVMCSDHMLSVMWDRSPRVRVRYFLRYRKVGGVESTYVTADTSHQLTGLQCGEQFSVRLLAQDAMCNSSWTSTLTLDTAPCPPTALEVQVECGTNLGIFTWVHGTGAQGYTVVAVGTHGHTASCSSVSTTCSMRLDCGHEYSATVFGTNAFCNSTISDTIHFDSAPCLPGNVMATIDCEANVFSVQWDMTPGTTSYMAIAIGSNGHQPSCTTGSTTCTIDDLQCGQTYGIIVTTASVECNTLLDSDYKVQSAPCRPHGLTVSLDCDTNVAVASWEYVQVTHEYRLTALDSQGQDTICIGEGGNCTFPQLTCGESYTFSAVGFTDQCESAVSNGADTLTAPCVPTLAPPSLDCDTATASVQWDAVRGATVYTAQAKNAEGYTVSCTSSATQCDILELPCGWDYDITVLASHRQCTTSSQQPATVSTGPCPSTSLMASLECRNNSAMISWSPGRGTISYSVLAESFGTTHTVSCTTGDSSCIVDSLECSQSYKVSVTGQGHVCSTPAGSWATIKTASCPPLKVKIQSSCTSDFISVSWASVTGVVSYMATAEGGNGHVASCSTTDTACNIEHLQCGQTYKVSVTAVDETCATGKSDIQILNTAPCEPLDVNVQLLCEVGILHVTWNLGTAVDLHFVEVVSDAGQAMFCQTEESTCVFQELPCGYDYEVIVVARRDVCNSSSVIKKFSGAPCPPVSVSTEVDCLTSIISVFWDSIVQGVHYIVNITESESRSQYIACNITDSQCTISELQCGKEYMAAVSGEKDTCTGAASAHHTFRTAPCVPYLTEVTPDCALGLTLVSWHTSLGAEWYVATVEDSLKGTLHCSTNDSSCTVPDLQCGQHYNVTVTADDPQCTSAPSNSLQLQMGPCPPTNVGTNVTCESGIVTATWSPSEGAVSYTATLEQMAGKVVSCSTDKHSCDIAGLPCGEEYTLTVVVQGRTCNSSKSVASVVHTVPCTPLSLQANLNCDNNVVTAYWTGTKGAQLYSVVAVGSDGHYSTCTSRLPHCYLRTLRCGQNYTATVVAKGNGCSSQNSSSADINTVPCTPSETFTYLECDSRTLTVFWTPSNGAKYYTAKVEDSDGGYTNCQIMGATSCSVAGLRCGDIYHVTVEASNDWCTSPESSVIEVHSVPCPPRHIKALVDCETGTALVSWDLSYGAVSYVATGEAASGDTVTCDTVNTNCETSNLECGEMYSFAVLALGDTCNATAHVTSQLMTGPCEPLNITAHYDLLNIFVYWDPSKGSSYYIAEAITDEGFMAFCNTTDNFCVLSKLVCGQMYNITVTANNKVCKDVAISESIVKGTEACPPADVQAHLDYETNTAYLSWEESDGALAYVATLEGRNGHTTFCYTTATYCTVDDLQCGTVYDIRVQAIGDTYNSSDSATVSVATGPCVPRSLKAKIYCEQDTVLVSWSKSQTVELYTITAMGSDGSRANCTTEDNSCAFRDLICGNLYTFSLTVSNQLCTILTPVQAVAQTRPCVPSQVAVDLPCGSRTAKVSWQESEGAQFYTAYATGAMGVKVEQCNTSGSSCFFSSLQCGESYTFTVAGHNSECYSDASEMVGTSTEPCPPQNLTVLGACANETVVVKWEQAEGVLDYFVSVVGNMGYAARHRTSDTTVSLELDCGQVYNISVVGENPLCDGSGSSTEFRTAPCKPKYVETYIQCEESLGSVTWTESDGAEFYTAVAVGKDGHTLTCTATTTNCTWFDLHCSNTYMVQVTADDYLCGSQPSDSAIIYTAPCTPQHLNATLNCSTKVTSLTWDASAMARLYMVTAESLSGDKVEVNVTKTRAYISALSCSQVYMISVVAKGSRCLSASSLPARIQTEPCRPSAVKYTINCDSNTAAVTWVPGGQADDYVVTGLTAGGDSVTCRSKRTRCSLLDLRCGQTYSVFVTAFNQQCKSERSDRVTVYSVPCVPENVNVDVDCMTNEALVSWNASQGVLSYHALAHSTESNTACESWEAACSLSQLLCGTAYRVSIVAVGRKCSSLPSKPVHIQSVPCAPEILAVNLDCMTNSVLVEWNYTEGAEFYTVLAESSRGTSLRCRSNYSTCELEGLDCGLVYSVSVMASDAQCDSLLGTSQDIESVPCTPQNLEAHVDCVADTAHVVWEASRGTEFYVVQAVNLWGYTAYCNSTESACVVPDLICSDSYNISVVAIAHQCNVSESDIIQLNSAPCAPNPVHASLNCETGAVMVTWELSIGATSYIAFAQGEMGYNSTCNTTDTMCEFTDLLCGQNYIFYAIASDDLCSSVESDVVNVDTVPCEPQNVSTWMDCDHNMGVVTWEDAEYGASFYVMAVGPDGYSSDCSSNSVYECMLPELHCGRMYSLTIIAQGHVCDSSPAYLSMLSVPCEPKNVKAAMHCYTNSAYVTWEDNGEAMSYQAVGRASGTPAVYCNTKNTYCSLEDLKCGKTYDISVLSLTDSCQSAEVKGPPARTEPCPPQQVNILVDCQSEIMQVKWDPNPDASSFRVSATPGNKTKMYCISNNTQCAIPHLPCGRTYSVYVVAVRDGCESTPSRTVQVSSVPCVPQGVSGKLDCVTNSVWVSWDAAIGAQSYNVKAESMNGHWSSCTTSETTCNIMDLICGTTYTFRVTSVGQQCESQPSYTFTMETAPCLLKSITATTECHSSAIQVNWERPVVSSLYIAMAEGNDGSMLYCNGTEGICYLEGVQCGMQYTVIVSTSSNKCSSLRSPPYKINTAPCTPKDIVIEEPCGAAGVVVSWEESIVADSYLLTAVESNEMTQACESSVNRCTLTGLQCGHAYSLSITATGGNCTSAPSPVVPFNTAPCGPTSVTARIDCIHNSTFLATVSWDTSSGSVQYFARVQPIHGEALFCSSTLTSCSVSDLICGAVYEFSVLASDGTCNSTFSKPIREGAAPCPPAVVWTRLLPMEDGIQIVRTTWELIDCPDVTYLVNLLGTIQGNSHTLMNVSSYWWEYFYFEIPVPCSSTYTVTVRARNAGGTGRPSEPITGSTAPCAPLAITYSRSNNATVLSWNASLFATDYSVYSLSGAGRTRVCSTSQLSCMLSNISHDSLEVIARNVVGQSNPSRDVYDLSSYRKKRDLREALMLSELQEEDQLTVRGLQAAAVGTSLHVEWVAVKGATYYTLMVREDTAERPTRPTVLSVYREAYTMTGLAPATTYCVSVSASGTSTSGPFSQPTCVSTGTPM